MFGKKLRTTGLVAGVVSFHRNAHPPLGPRSGELLTARGVGGADRGIPPPPRPLLQMSISRGPLSEGCTVARTRRATLLTLFLLLLQLSFGPPPAEHHRRPATRKETARRHRRRAQQPHGVRRRRLLLASRTSHLRILVLDPPEATNVAKHRPDLHS